MEDLISRQAVIDLFAERLNGWTLEEAIPIVDRFVNEREQCDDVWHAVITIRDIAECVKQDVEKYLPSADRPSWIPCSERLPRYDETSEYLVTDKDGRVRHCCLDPYMPETFVTVEEGMMVDVVAWRPAPEPYKEVQE